MEGKVGGKASPTSVKIWKANSSCNFGELSGQ